MRLITKSQLSYLLQICLLFGAYFISGKIGLWLDPVEGFAAYVWLPTGISLAALLLFGYRLFPAIVLGAFLVNLTNGAPLPVAIGITIGNTLEAIVGVYLLKKFRFHCSLETHQDVFKLIVFAAILSTFISSAIGVSSLLLGNVIPISSVVATGIAWWVGDGVSNLLVAPFVFILVSKPLIRVQYKRIAEAIFLFSFVILTGLFVFGGILGVHSTPITYLVFPPLIWAAFRFNQKMTIFSIVIISILAIWSTALGYGPFVRSSLQESLYHLQSFMGVIAATALLLAAVVSERRYLEKRKDDFISIASHELKTPLTSIKAFAQLTERMLRQNERKKASIYLQRVDGQLNRLVHLVNDLLDVSKIQTNRFDLRYETFSMHTFLAEIVEEIEATYKKHKISILGNPKHEVYADKERIGQVVTNILINAIKYSPNAKKISLRVKSSQGKIIVSIRDYGIGIAEENQRKIFQLFYRTDESQNLQQGLGIGLYLSSYIVKQHGGKIWVESKKLRGSTFHVMLPV